MKQLIKIEITIFWMFMALMVSSSQIAFGQNCLSFDGNNDVVHIPDDNTLDLTSKGTLEAWIYITSYVNYAGIIHKGDNSGYPMPDEAYTLQFGASGFLGSTNSKLLFAIFDSSNYDYVVSATSLGKNTWYHVAAVWNSNDRYIRIYINGVLDAENTGASRVARSTSGGLNIGAQLYDPISYEFNGKIDEIRIWAKSLSQSEIRQNMYKEIDIAPNSKLKAYYKFNTGSGALANDASSNGNDGISMGTFWVTSTCPTAHQWLGTTSSNWNNVSNWFAGWKPNADIPVEISSSATFQPEVHSISNNSVTIYSFEKSVYIKTNKPEFAEYIIIDMFGREVKSGVCHDEITEIDLNNYPGNYIVQYSDKNETITKKINIIF